ncbi:MAG TPA: hypothetical protein VMV29_02450 [Ktedonobacterales bacterium]|nr:hypothetical protein [Ktedonobacterales bacterium]
MSHRTTEVTVHQAGRRRPLKRPFGQAIIVALGLAALAALAACSNGGVVVVGCNGGAACVRRDTAAGQIVIQLFDAPGFIYPSVNGVPEWTLYGDGTLIFQHATPTASGQPTLVSAQLTSAQVTHILDVVVNQRHFFASNQPSYGRRIPDAGLTLLYVSANGQQKLVSVAGVASGADAQTQNVFAIVQYLRGYAPAGAQPYTPTGVALLAIARGQATGGEAVWPSGDIALATVASRACSLIGVSACIAKASQSGVSAVTGAAGADLLRLADGRGFFAQDGESYFVTVWPLMPDALHPQPGQSAAVRVAKASGSIASWPLLG